jgi:mono/diheme cytochrome c family protein
MSLIRRRVPLYALTVSLLSGPVLAPAGEDATALERGRYLVTLMDCSGCHTPGALAGQPDATRYLAGSSIGFQGREGTVYPPNLTPDRETGLGAWSDEAILAAVKTGRRPDGRILAPVMPWPSYANLTADDGRALVTYLRSLPPVRLKAPGPVPAGEEPRAPYLTLMTPK